MKDCLTQEYWADLFCLEILHEFFFVGCFWHGHDCFLNKGKTVNTKRNKSMGELFEETQINSQYIKDEGYNLIEMWECEWQQQRQQNPALKQFLATHVYRPLDRHKHLSQDQILQAVKCGQLFGVVECDIEVPEHLKPKFSEMTPIFKNVEISRDDIGEYMKAFGEEHNIMPRPRRSLVGSFFGKKILLATPLLIWYLEHGLEVTNIYQVVEYSPVPCFEPFGEAVSNARREGDRDSNKLIKGETMKLVSVFFLE